MNQLKSKCTSYILSFKTLIRHLKLVQSRQNDDPLLPYSKESLCDNSKIFKLDRTNTSQYVFKPSDVIMLMNDVTIVAA